MSKTNPNGALLSPNQDDDFREIKKITQPVARALYELKITRFADLAALTPEKLADLLRAKNVPFVSAQRIEREDWIGQAWLLAGKKAENAVSGEQIVPAAGKDSRKDQPGMRNQSTGPARHGWRELADFFVSFGEEISGDGKAKLKTKAHFSQGDLPFERDGIATSELVEWMLRQANLTVVEGDPQAPAAAQPPENRAGQEAHREEPLPLLVSNLWVSQVDSPASAGQGVECMVRVEADVDVPDVDVPDVDGTSVDLSSETAGYLTGPILFMMSIYLVNTQTNASIFIETPSITVSQEMLPYAFQHDFPVPPPGRYQLYLLAGLPSTGKAPIVQQGPIVRVEG